MKITVESTEKLVTLNGVPARVWEGQTESGTPVHCFITRIVPVTHDQQQLAEFERELKEQRKPSVVAEAIPLRMIL